ncbi:MAG: DegT/DnrJ/EryC1/StrS family aminotransferase [Bacteroidota bacterium]
MIPVTKPFMPPHKKYLQYVQGIWERNYLTNNGPLVQKLEKKLRDYLGVDHMLYLSNGTIALQIAIKTLELKGEIITTPFSYVATTSSIVWEGCKPVFVDIDPNTLNLNPDLIENAISENTTAILATHVFGNPCDIETIQKIAYKHDLKVIYDAAHCFGTTYKGLSVFEYGDISTTSFHATKLFHTVEGGAVFTKNEELNHRMNRMRNFGHAGFEQFDGVGINGKNSEFHAAMGLCNLDHVEEIMVRRKQQCMLYDELLSTLPIQGIKVQDESKWNYAYYPSIFESEVITLNVKKALENNNIYPRRYFYPSLDTLDYVKTKNLIVSKDISKRILCLPLYHDLNKSEQNKIFKVVNENIK